MKKSLLFKITVIIFAFIGLISNVNAQVTTSSMTGSISDKQGPLPGASIKVVHVPTGTVYGSTSNTNGRFTIANMRVGGPYSVVVSFIGFEPKKFNDIYLKLGGSYVLNVVLSDNSQDLSEVVIAGTKDKIINSSRTGAATNVSKKQLEQLPAISRALKDLTKLTPQANTTGSDGLSFAGRNSLFNSLSLDGAQMNNAFGIGALPGGSTGAQPFSLDAIEEIQINLAPYDVKQSGFTGAGINAITKAGTNKFSGSVYTYYKDQNLQGYDVGDFKVPQNKDNAFVNKQFGFRLGGPIIKDKLFFFVNGEISRRTAPGTTFAPNRGEAPNTPGISRVTASDMLRVKNLLMSKYGYDVGELDGYSNLTESDNITARLDWNINASNRFTVRYNYLNSFDDKSPSGSNSNSGRGPNQNSMIFSNMRYKQIQNINSVTAELNSRFGNKFANNLQLVYSAFRDKREQSGAFPTVDIEDGTGRNYISLGTEPFSGLNAANQDIYTLNENFNIFAGDHTITVGGSIGYQKFGNAFAQFYNGQFRYKNLTDFENAVNGIATNPLLYQLTYSADPKNPRPFATFEQMPVSVYIQDEWFVKPNFKLTYGVRADIPFFTGKIASNPRVTDLTFRDGERLDVGQLPKTRILLAPRVGFNWDVMGDATFQIRGGSGIFTGAVPGVWFTNQAGNTGLMFGNDNLVNPGNRPFSPNPGEYIPANPTVPTSFAINLTSKDFKMPQIWRSNLAFDYKLPGGVLATIEGMYTKSINEVYHRNANLVLPSGSFSGTGDTRPYFPGIGAGPVAAADPNRINKFITNAIVLDNTNKGYAYNITAQLQKKFGTFIDATVAYTRSDARDITSNPGSQANSAFAGNPVIGDPNTPVLAYSSFVVKNRVIAAVNFNFNIARNMPSSIGVVYEGSPYGDNFGNTRFSYMASGDVNGDNNGNDLMYVPRDKADAGLIPITGAKAESVDSQWARLDAYINQDDYLKTRRGQYAERNGAEYPWVNRFDIRFMQEIKTVFNKDNDNRFQITFDIINFGNLLNKNWGITQTPNLTNFMVYKGRVGNAPSYTVSSDLPEKTFRDNTGIASRWQGQVGIRYLFN
ncbi:carboxypeptidase regulatory-like domain-containing protein [Pedobacter gandavensis]|uniref:TonB-dependent receptor n=1 Tax=Pedobacter gandavensis TaxID=2679963 RepID=UPI00292FA2C1|nr:carboxypeptidase regulatory-like domain-containing protein [Pedobacter gandavensis]